MAALLTSNFNLPAELSEGIFKKVQTGSAIARLAGAAPQKFGKGQVITLTGAPKAELVGEGGSKAPTPTEYAPKTVQPLKVQVTMRFSDEVKWADEDTQVGILADMAENASIALARALDLVGIHKINPLTGTVSSLVTDGITDTTLAETIASGAYDVAIENAAGKVIAKGYTPSGVALDPTLSFGLATMRDKQGRKIYPEMGFGQNLNNFMGMEAAVSDTVSGKNELATAGNIVGIVGQWDAFRWGVQRQIGVTMIEYGDPDGLGDLQRMNQIALRAEIVYAVGVLAKDAFAKVCSASAE